MQQDNQAYALVRVSTAAQAGEDRQGLAVQREEVNRIAAYHGLEILETVELQISGTQTVHHPEFRRVLEGLRSPGVIGLVVPHLDRLVRRGDNEGGFKDVATILDAIKDSSTTLFTSSGAVDLSRDMDATSVLFQLEMAASERRAIIRRTKAGRERVRREKGYRPEGDGRVGLPRGITFDRSADPPQYRYTKDADQVREAYKLLLGGLHNLTAISRKTGIGSYVREGKLVGNATTLRKTLENPMYAGRYEVKWHWQTRYTESGRKQIKKVARAKEDQYVHHDMLEPLIPIEDWNRAQKILDDIRSSRPKPRTDEARRELWCLEHASCPECGSKLGPARARTGRWDYRCPKSHTQRGSNRCLWGQVSARKLHQVADDQLTLWLGDVYLDSLVRAAEQARDQEMKTTPVEDLDTVIKSAQRKIQRLHSLYADDKLDETTYRVKLTRAESELAQATAAKAATPKPVAKDVVESIRKSFKSFHKCSNKRKRELLAEFGVAFEVRRWWPELEWVEEVDGETIRHDDGAGPKRSAELRLMPIEVFSSRTSTRTVGDYKKMKRLGIE